MINTQTNQVVGSPITVGGFPGAIAIIPNQPPTASFTTAQARPGVPLAFDASASHDFDGQIANYDWDFGDGQSSPIDGPITTHTYTAPGTYRATLTLTDNEGCSTADTILFTGQTAFCGGSALATAAKTEALASETIRVAFPKIRVRCPRRAKPRGCEFRLQAVALPQRLGRERGGDHEAQGRALGRRRAEGDAGLHRGALQRQERPDQGSADDQGLNPRPLPQLGDRRLVDDRGARRALRAARPGIVRGAGATLLCAVALAVVLLAALASSARAGTAYVANEGTNSVSVIDTATNTAIPRRSPSALARSRSRSPPTARPPTSPTPKASR